MFCITLTYEDLISLSTVMEYLKKDFSLKYRSFATTDSTQLCQSAKKVGQRKEKENIVTNLL